jgi:membrane protease YdiL (CAAX protease family)
LGFSGLLLCAGGLIGCYLIIYDVNKDLVKLKEINLAQNFISVFSFILLMGITNPLLEEFFWRNFLQKANEIYFI